MKIVIPVAGIGSRLKPHTHTVPKPLIEVAGKPMLDYVVEEALKVNPDELIFVVGYKKEAIIEHIRSKYSNIRISFVEQVNRDGDGSAVKLALDHVEKDSNLVVFFGDTLIDFDLKKAIEKQKADGIVFSMEVSTPQHYGVLELDENMEIHSIEEKPENPKSNHAIIGTYYFSSLQKVKRILTSIIENQETMGGEYKLAKVLQYYINDDSLSLKASPVKNWFDCGRPEILLRSNQYFLEKKSKSNTIEKQGSTLIIPPCYISESATITSSIIGPNVSIGSGVTISNSKISDSIISHNSEIDYMLLEESIVGKEVVAKGKAQHLNLGEKSVFISNN